MAADVNGLPAGFALDTPSASPAPVPDGFVLDRPAATSSAAIPEAAVNDDAPKPQAPPTAAGGSTGTDWSHPLQSFNRGLSNAVGLEDIGQDFQNFGSGLKQGTYSGFAEDLPDSARAVASKAVTPRAENPNAAPISMSDFSTGAAAGKLGYQFGASSPTTAAGLVTGAIGSAAAGGPETPLGAGVGLATGAAGAGAMAAAQQIGPYFRQEMAQTPNDPDGAYVRAWEKAGQSAGFSAAGWGLFALKPFAGPAKQIIFDALNIGADTAENAASRAAVDKFGNLAAQALVVQPGLSEAENTLNNIEAGNPAFEGAAQTYVGGMAGNVVPLAAFEGAHAAYSRLRGGVPRETSPTPDDQGTPPIPDGQGDAPTDDHALYIEKLISDLTSTGASRDEAIAHLHEIGVIPKASSAPQDDHAAYIEKLITDLTNAGASREEAVNHLREIGVMTPAASAPFADLPDASPLAQKVEQAASQVASPSDAQKQSGNYAKGHVNIQGLPITIETPRGAERSGVDPDGNPWSVQMPDHYGYIKKTEGADGDHVDTYIGPQPDNKIAYVVDQVDADTGKFDKHKVMLGYPDQQSALNAYQRAFSDGRAQDRIGGVSEMPVSSLKDWLNNGDTAKPLAGTKIAASGQQAAMVTRLHDTAARVAQPISDAPNAPRAAYISDVFDAMQPKNTDPMAAIGAGGPGRMKSIGDYNPDDLSSGGASDIRTSDPSNDTGAQFGRFDVRKNPGNDMYGIREGGNIIGFADTESRAWKIVAGIHDSERAGMLDQSKPISKQGPAARSAAASAIYAARKYLADNPGEAVPYVAGDAGRAFQDIARAGMNLDGEEFMRLLHMAAGHGYDYAYSGLSDRFVDPAEMNSLISEAVGDSKTEPMAALGANGPEIDDLGFYSRALESARNMKQAKGTPEQMRAQLKSAGVKDSEIAATHLDQVLQGPSVTRDQIVRHLMDNRVGLKESQRETLEAYNERMLARESRGEQVFAPEGSADLEYGGAQKYSKYSLDKGSNPTYRETVLHLPREAEPIIAKRKASLDEFRALQDKHSAGNASVEEQARMEDLRKTLIDYAEQANAADRRNFQSGHWSEPNVIAHARTSMQTTPDGRPVFNVDELQSDWGQKIRDSDGARDEGRVDELSRLVQQERDSYKSALDDANNFVSIHSDQPRVPTEDWIKLNVALSHVKSADHLGGGYQRVPGQYGMTPIPKRPITDAMRAQATDLMNRARPDNLALREAELRTAQAAVPGHPLVNTSDQWQQTAMKMIIRQAVESGADGVTIPNGKTVHGYGMGTEGGKDSHEGINYAYEQMYPKQMAKLLAKIDPDIKPQKTLIKGHEDKGEFTYFPLTEKAKAKVTGEGQPMFASSVNTAGKAKLAMAAGQTFKRPETEAASTHDQITDAAKSMPTLPGTKIGTLDQVTPIKGSDNVLARFRLTDGGYKTVSLSKKFLSATRAIFVGSKSEDGGFLGSTRLGDTSNLGHSLAGELWHELTHSKVANGVLWGRDLDRLIRHSFDLDVMGIDQRDYLAHIGDHDASAKADPFVNLFETYKTIYKDRGEDVVRQKIKEESVAHMIELWKHGVLTDEQMAPVQDLLDRHFGDKTSGASSSAGDRTSPADQGMAASGPRLGKGLSDLSQEQKSSGKGVERVIAGRTPDALSGNGTQGSLAQREAAARAVMSSPEWAKAGSDHLSAQEDTSKQPGYGSLNWQRQRQYTGNNGEPITGFDTALTHFMDRALDDVPGGAAYDKQAFILIGYPGSGKSSIAKAIQNRYHAARVVGDDAKPMIPEYRGGANNGGVKAESDQIASQAAAHLAKTGANLILETSGTHDGVMRRVDALKGEGYKVALVHASVPKAVAMERAISRFKTEGRPVPLEIYDKLKAGDVYDKLKAEGKIDATARFEPQDPNAAGYSPWKITDANGGLETLRSDFEPSAWKRILGGRFEGSQNVHGGFQSSTALAGRHNKPMAAVSGSGKPPRLGKGLSDIEEEQKSSGKGVERVIAGRTPDALSGNGRSQEPGLDAFKKHLTDLAKSGDIKLIPAKIAKGDTDAVAKARRSAIVIDGKPVHRIIIPKDRAEATQPPRYVDTGITGRVHSAIDRFGMGSIVRDIQMKLTPMAARDASTAARAGAKDFANEMRVSRWDQARIDGNIKRDFTTAQQEKMWKAADEESVLRQTGRDTRGRGLDRLTPVERDAVERMQAASQAEWQNAKDVGIVDAKKEGLPSYTPRMIAMITGERPKSGDGQGGKAINAIGNNLKTFTSQLLRRKHLTTEETEGAAKSKLGDDANVAQNIRTLPLATTKLREAVAGRRLINEVKRIGEQSGDETVREGSEPADSPYKWFTIDNPAFKVFRPKFTQNPETGLMEPVKDQHGQPVFEKVPLYVRSDFEGPLRAVLSRDTGAIYGALMALKGRAMGVIMYSPAIHNMVEFGRAFPTMPGRMITLRVYFDGNALKNDPAQMREAVNNGLVPIGHRGSNQDITSMMEEPNIKPGRSWTAQAAGALPNRFDPKAGDAVKRWVDKAGDVWHNTLLWDRIADLQAGLYKNFRDDMIAKGIDRQTAARAAAHFANRYAGALPAEAMSSLSRKIANVTMFSRSFTLGNLGAMKDVVRGLPDDVSAQIMRDAGLKSLDKVRGYAQRKAFAVVATDLALFYAGNSLLQNAVQYFTGQDLSQIEKGYVDRLSALFHRAQNDPISVLNPFTDLQSLTPMADNEPGKQDRVLVGYQSDGTAIYARNPIGKIGEEFKGWLTSPLDMVKRKLSPFAQPLLQTISNDKGFGRKVYDTSANASTVANLGRIVGLFMGAELPIPSIQAAAELVQGRETQDQRNVDLYKTLGPLAGITFSKGAPGGPAMGEIYAAKEEHDFAVQQSLPGIKDMIRQKNIDGARKQMTSLSIPIGLQNYYIRTTLNPGLKMSGKTAKEALQYMTPDERAAFMRDKAHSSTNP